jgi:hypothetical protein
MQNEVRERLMVLCEQASAEQNPQKLLKLIQQINQLLEAKQARLNKKQADEREHGLTDRASG